MHKYIICLVLIMSVCYCAKLPIFISRCKAGDNTCIVSAANKAIPKLLNGYKPFKIRSLKPFHFEHIDLSQGETLRVELSDGVVTKFDSGVLTEADISSDWTKWVLKGILDFVVDSNYEVSGQLFVFPVRGKGKCHLEFDRVVIEYTAHFNVSEKTDGKYLQLDRDDIKLEMAAMRSRFDNLFDGEKILGDNINSFINENWKDVEREFHSGHVQLIRILLRAALQPITNHVPINEIAFS